MEVDSALKLEGEEEGGGKVDGVDGGEMTSQNDTKEKRRENDEGESEGALNGIDDDDKPYEAVIKLSPSDLEMSDESEDDDGENNKGSGDSGGDDDDEDGVQVKDEVESEEYDSSSGDSEGDDGEGCSSASWNSTSDDEDKPKSKRSSVKVKVEKDVVEEKEVEGKKKKKVAVKRKVTSSPSKAKRPRGRPKQPRRLGVPDDYTSEEDVDGSDKKPVLRQGSGYPVEFKLKVLKYADTHSNAATAEKFGLNAKRIRDWRKTKFKIEEESKGSWKRRPRSDGYTVEEKLQAVAFALERSTDEARLLYNVDRRTIEKWKSKKAQLEARMQKGEGSFIRRVGSGRKPRYTQIEEHLRDWIVGLRLKGLVVNNRMILTKAKQLMELDPTMQDLPVPRTGTWVIGFLKRQNLFGLIGTTLGHEDPQEILNAELKTGESDLKSLAEKIIEIPENPNKRHRRTISLDDKMNIIRRIEQGETQGTVAKSLKVATSTIQTIWSCRTEIMHKFANPKSKTSDARVWKMYSVIGSALHDWLEQNSAKIPKIDCSILMEKAIQLAETYRLSNFTGGQAKHWLRIFCKRHNLNDALIEIRGTHNSNILYPLPTSKTNISPQSSQQQQILPPPVTTSINSVDSLNDHHQNEDDFQTDFNFTDFLSQMHNDSQPNRNSHSIQPTTVSLSSIPAIHYPHQHLHVAPTSNNLLLNQRLQFPSSSLNTSVVSCSDAVKHINQLRSWIQVNYGPHEEILNNHLSMVENAVLKKRMNESSSSIMGAHGHNSNSSHH